MYDSLNIESYLKAAKPILSKIAYQLDTKGRISIYSINMQKQEGFVDCGLFAIACALELCQLRDPAKITFKQNEMLNHLQTCFTKGKLSSFPQLTESRPESIVQKVTNFNKFLLFLFNLHFVNLITYFVLLFNINKYLKKFDWLSLFF